jgi:hypothetical protein
MSVTIRRINSKYPTNSELSSVLGSLKPISVSTASNYTLSADCRVITCTSGSKIVVNMMCDDGGVSAVSLPALPYFPILNVTSILSSASGTDATDINLWPFEF